MQRYDTRSNITRLKTNLNPMVGKPCKKKQAVGQHERSERPVSVEVLLQEQACLPVLFVDLIHALEALESSVAQQRLLQSRRRTVKTFLTEAEPSTEEFTSALRLWLRLYLLPEFFPLRTAVEWLVSSSALAELSARRGEEIVGRTTRDVGREVLTAARAAVAAVAAVTADSVPAILRWMPSLSALVALDRDFPVLPWTTSWTAGSQLDEDALWSVHGVASLLHEAAAALLTTLGSGTLVGSSKASIQLDATLTDTLRSLAALLKPRREHLLQVLLVEQKSSWLHLLRRGVLPAALSALSISSKDTQSAAAALIALLLELTWTLSGMAGMAGTAARASVELSEHCEAFLASLSSEHPLAVWVVLEEVVDLCGLNLSPTAECALVKAFIQGFVLHPPAVNSPGGYYSGTALSRLYLGRCLGALLVYCGHCEAAVQLFALQAVEAWVARLRVVVLALVTSNTEAFLEENVHAVLRSKAAGLLRVLISSWDHPVRQVL